MQPTKTERQIKDMRVAGKILAEIFTELREKTRVGVNELEINKWVEREIIKHGAVVTYKTQQVNFPGSICISVNDAVVHGVPKNYCFEKGDIVGYDLDVTYGGMTVDAAFTMIVGERLSGAKKHLLSTTERAMWAGVNAAGPIHIGDISFAIQQVLDKGKLGIVRELVGHGVGNSFHMDPDVPNYGHRGIGVLLSVGDTISIEPMATLGGDAIKLDDDGWTYKTKDSSLAAHFEHTILITKDGCEVLTQL